MSHKHIDSPLNARQSRDFPISALGECTGYSEFKYVNRVDSIYGSTVLPFNVMSSLGLPQSGTGKNCE